MNEYQLEHKRDFKDLRALEKIILRSTGHRYYDLLKRRDEKIRLYEQKYRIRYKKMLPF